MSAIRPLSGAQRTSAQRVIARPPAFAIGLPVALLGSLDLGGLTLLALAWRTGGDDNRFLGALQPLDLLFEFGDPLLALWQPASG
jgi:hypothetical protein